MRVQPLSRASLAIFLNTVDAFFIREFMTRYSKFRFGYMWAVVDPVYQVSLMMLIHGVLRGGKSQIYGASPFVFFFLGVIPFLAFSKGYHHSLGAISGNSGLFNYKQIRPFDIVVVKVLLEFLTMGLVFAAAAALGWWIDFDYEIEDPLALGLVYLLLAMFTLGFGLFAEVLSVLYPDIRRVIGLTDRPLYLMSGVFYTIDMLPENVKPFLLWNPILHATDLARGVGMAGYEPQGSWTYLASSSVIVLFLGLAAYRRYLSRLL